MFSFLFGKGPASCFRRHCHFNPPEFDSGWGCLHSRPRPFCCQREEDGSSFCGLSLSGGLFFPLVVESLGVWSDEAIDIIKSIGGLQGQRLGISPNESTQHLFQRLAVSLWKGMQCRPLDSPVPNPLPPGRWTGVIVELCVVFCAVFLCCLF